MEEVQAQQKILIHAISHALDNFKKIGKANYTYGIVRNRLSKLKDDYARFEACHARILALATKEFIATDEYFTKKQFDACEELYLTASDYMEEYMVQLEPPNTSTPNASAVSQPLPNFSTRTSIQLPRINLPKFSGAYSEWETFRDQFQSLINDNVDLSNVTRLQYLISCLKGEALDVIRNIALIDANFKVAWDSLLSRYDNHRRLVHEHIHTLHTLPQATTESSASLTVLRDKANIAIQALKNLDRAVDTWDDMLVYLIVHKLDKATRKAWELQLGNTTNYPSYEQLEQFLASRIRALDNILPTGSISKGKQVSSAIQSHTTIANPTKCPMCQKTHFLSSCPEFRSKTSAERRELVNNYRCCFNCLNPKHTRKSCLSKHSCRQCQQRHHTLLHESNSKSIDDSSSSSTAPKARPVEDTSAITTHLLSKPSFSKSNILLATAWVRVSGSSGRNVIVRALLDQGSVTTLITERLAQRLRLQRKRVSVNITGIDDAASTAKHAALIQIAPRNDSDAIFSTNALILGSLTKYVPQRVENITQIEYLRQISLADPDPTSDDPIDIIIGADLYGVMLLPGIRSRNQNELVAQNSVFGWIISGPTPAIQPSSNSILSLHQCVMSEPLETQLKTFWEIEELPHQTHCTPEEVECENHFIKNHSRTPTGRYVVRLPFKTSLPLNIGESRTSVLKFYNRAESRLKAQPEKANEYNEFLRDYERLGHMIEAPVPDGAGDQVLYFPHHAVIREHSTTTHLRVVFNASFPTSNGLALNDHLLIGPKLQTDLPTVIMRWRLFRYVYSADISKMYRQILIDSRDVNYQRILWRPNNNSSVKDYQLLTVTYGTASAPYLALRVLQQVAIDDGSKYPLAVPIIRQHIYVDDCLFGADDIPLARQTKDHLISLLNCAGFKLRKWASNNPSLLDGIDPQDQEAVQAKRIQNDEHLKILGIKWNPSTDSFQFNIEISTSPPETKRTILSAIAKVFDPLGWLAPVVITSKILMQKLWLLKCDWDEVIPSDLLIKWQKHYLQLPALAQISIPRWTEYGSDISSAELHGFADASTAAYGAVVYLKITKLDGSVQVTLLTAKSKVAPLKPVSIPRLELCATVLLARTITFVRPIMHPLNLRIHCWSDSTVTLSWLAQSPSKWKVFVANRVHEVQSQVPDAIWHHVASLHNPADLISRGVNPSNLLEASLWWQGPAWIKLSEDQWPLSVPPPPNDVQIELRKNVSTHHSQIPIEWDLANRFSSWNKLLHVTAYIMRFTNRLRKRTTRKLQDSLETFALLPNEITAAKTFWFRSIQKKLFAAERQSLHKEGQIKKGSKLSALNPYLDNDDLLRVGGRLRHSEIDETAKHPVILASHPLVSLIINDIHFRALHAGPQLTLALVRNEIWLLRARQTIRAVLHRCIKCVREKASVPTELMGDLPDYRVRPSGRAFLHCGIDYAGPIKIRQTPGRGHKSRKAYIAVFICMTVKASHLELVNECSTAAFLAAFERFCARRGIPSDVYSDNATNFQGAQRELAAIWKTAICDPTMLTKFADRGIKWHFIPPSSPHFGGLWEACVRSVKHHLKRVIGCHTLTVEEMTTLLCKIEACLNSRPIAPMSDNVEDYMALTPGHFITGSALLSIPEPSLLEVKETRLTRWQLISQMRDGFWKAWSSDYLQTLQQRPKWRSVQNEAQIGRLVLLRNPLAPPCQWELGRIEECHPGDDGLTRVVTVATARSKYKRAIAKLCFLPVDLNRKPDDSSTG